jgi:hypothetical protein
MPERDHLDDGLDPGYLDDDLGPDVADYLRGRRDDLDDDDLYPGVARPRGEIAPEALELDKIPRALWEQALAPVPRQERFYVAQRVADDELRELAHKLVGALDVAERRSWHARETARARARRTAAALPVADAAHAATRPTVQLNMRLRRDDYERVREAATAVGMKPTTLARALVLNGVAKVLQERASGRPGAT